MLRRVLRRTTQTPSGRRQKLLVPAHNKAPEQGEIDTINRFVLDHRWQEETRIHRKVVSSRHNKKTPHRLIHPSRETKCIKRVLYVDNVVTLSVFMMSNVVLLSRPVETLSNRNTVCGPHIISPDKTRPARDDYTTVPND